MHHIRILAAIMLAHAASIPPAAAQDGHGIRQLPVPVAAIAAGDIIRADDLTQRKFKTTPRSLSGIAMTADEIAGKEARRSLRAGRPIPLSAIMTPLAVRRGERVTAFYEDAGLSISTELLALEDGSTGDIISLRNISTGLVVRAEVLEGGRLAVRSE